MVLFYFSAEGQRAATPVLACFSGTEKSQPKLAVDE